MNNLTAITADNLGTLPKKVAPFVGRALGRGLLVAQNPTSADSGLSSYVVSSVNPIDDWQLWIAHQAGANGGRLTLTRYAPTATKRPNTVKRTQAEARLLIDDMGDSLDRHVAREAAKPVAVVTEFTGDEPATVTLSYAMSKMADTISAGRARFDAATSTVQDDNAQQETAQLMVNQLRANGRFALRMARLGRIPANTSAVVRTALVNRGLIQAAGGTLTDVGRVAHTLILNH